MRCDLYAHVQKLSHSFYDRNRSGSLTSRIVSDVETILPFLSVTLVQTWMNLAVIITVMVYLFGRSTVLGWLSVALVPVNILLVHLVGRKSKIVARQTRRQLSWLSGNTQERLAAQTIVKTFAREESEIRRFTDDSQALVSMGTRAATLGGINQAGTAALNTLAPLLVILVGGWLGLFRPETVSLGLLVRENVATAQKAQFAIGRIVRECTALTNVVAGTGDTLVYDMVDATGTPGRRTLAWQQGGPLTLNNIPLSDDVGNFQLRYYETPDGTARTTYSTSVQLLEITLQSRAIPYRTFVDRICLRFP